jgi:hypothetical protein
VCFIFAVLPISSALVSPPSTYCRALFPAPRDELQTYLSVVGVCLNAISFPWYFLFACICFFPVFLFVLLLIIMLSPCWFGWIPFGLDLCVVDVYVTLTFGSRRKVCMCKILVQARPLGPGVELGAYSNSHPYTSPPQASLLLPLPHHYLLQFWHSCKSLIAIFLSIQKSHSLLEGKTLSMFIKN